MLMQCLKAKYNSGGKLYLISFYSNFILSMFHLAHSVLMLFNILIYFLS